MLKLIENSIGRKENWSPYEKSLRFTVSLLAWWGSFRLGELISQRKCICLVKNPKVLNEDTGDVVEVWAVPEIPDLDPITALTKFLQLRKSKFGEAESYPLFLHENGSVFTKKQMNIDLGVLLAIYPELNSPVDKWTGHSFRAGISTLLATLGFKG